MRDKGSCKNFSASAILVQIGVLQNVLSFVDIKLVIVREIIFEKF